MHNSFLEMVIMLFFFFIVFHIPYSFLFIEIETVSLNTIERIKMYIIYHIMLKLGHERTYRREIGKKGKVCRFQSFTQGRGMSSSPCLFNLCAPVRRPGSLSSHSRVSKSTLLRVSKILLKLHELQKFTARLLE